MNHRRFNEISGEPAVTISMKVVVPERNAAAFITELKFLVSDSDSLFIPEDLEIYPNEAEDNLNHFFKKQKK